ncbi:MAG: threonylcarbamoyl-AMP synthase [Lachnospiraceae bacterium]|nr:threonylcarbamoyl-AMP synthase [Lachnospiraceae bacterium]
MDSLNTRYVEISPEDIDDKVLSEAGDILKAGGLVAFPTETVYGLGGDGLNPLSSKKIYEAKGRPSDNPLILHIASMDAVEHIAKDVTPEAYKLMEQFWPGPLTVILNKKDNVPDETTGGLKTVAIRMPSHPVAKRLIELSGLYIAAPSANTSGRPSPTKGSHVKEDLFGKIDMIIDSGAVGIGIESSIIDMTGERPMLLRPGYIKPEDVEEVLGEVDIDPVVLGKLMPEGTAPKAPGMKYRHYAPKGDMEVVKGEEIKVSEYILKNVRADADDGKRVAILTTEENKAIYQKALDGLVAGEGNADKPGNRDKVTIISLGSCAKAGQISAHLFDALRSLDNMDIEMIYSETFYEDDMGMAVMNRLLKAAAYKVIEV